MTETVHTEQVEAQGLHQNTTALHEPAHLEAALLPQEVLPTEVREQEQVAAVPTEAPHLDQVLTDHPVQAEALLAEVPTEVQAGLQVVLVLIEAPVVQVDPPRVLALGLLDRTLDHLHQAEEIKFKIIKSNLL
ncbi:hypothetical protein ZORO111903_19175 [Zobellia roscoffensis]